MNWTTILTTLTGPTMAVARYGLTALGTWMVTKGYVDDATAQQVIGAVIAVGSAAIGAATSTKAATIAKTTTYADVAGVTKTDGSVQVSP